MKITIHVPQVPAGVWSNLAGLAGLAAVVAAVGGLTGNWWWSVLTGGAAAVALAVLAQLGDQQAEPRTAAAARTPVVGPPKVNLGPPRNVTPPRASGNAGRSAVS